MDKPIVGIAGQTEVAADAYGIKRRYVDYLRRAGALVVVVPPGFPEGDAGELLDGFDGLLVPGGDNVDPELYGEPLRGDLPLAGRERDDAEMALIKEARRRSMPVLGLCRGLQAVNVACGGTLAQRVTDRPVAHWQGEPFSEPSHGVRVAEGTPLFRALGNPHGPLSVNSMHRQGIDRLAESLEAAAWADDGLVEGIFDPRSPFFLAVQWHPEFLADDAPSDALALAFVEACAAYRAGRRAQD